MFKKIICVLLCVLVLTTPAKAQESGITVSAKGAILMELETGLVLYEKDADTFLPMASTTKIMTALLTLEQEHLDRVFLVDEGAIRIEGSSMGLQKNDKVTLRTLAAGMLLASGNDAANAAAVKIGGSITRFVEMMNERAKEIGMEHTVFETPSGLDGENHGSTARDMALLAAEALKNEDFLAICSSSTMKLSYGNPAYDRYLSNHNRLLKEYEGCIGLKTGYTKKAGRCLVSAAKRDGITLICVTLNDPNDWQDHKDLLDYGFSLLEPQTVNPNLPAGYPVVGGVLSEVPLTAEPLTTAQRKGETADLISRFVPLRPFLYAPVEEGMLVGYLTYYQQKDGTQTPLKTVPVLAVNTVEYRPPEKISLFQQWINRLRRWLGI